MNRYSEIEPALDFADKFHASNVTIELDNGTLTDTPARIREVYDNIEIGEAFTLISINWEA